MCNHFEWWTWLDFEVPNSAFLVHPEPSVEVLGKQGKWYLAQNLLPGVKGSYLIKLKAYMIPVFGMISSQMFYRLGKQVSTLNQTLNPTLKDLKREPVMLAVMSEWQRSLPDLNSHVTARTRFLRSQGVVPSYPSRNKGNECELATEEYGARFFSLYKSV